MSRLWVCKSVRSVYWTYSGHSVYPRFSFTTPTTVCPCRPTLESQSSLLGGTVPSTTTMRDRDPGGVRLIYELIISHLLTYGRVRKWDNKGTDNKGGLLTKHPNLEVTEVALTVNLSPLEILNFLPLFLMYPQ